MFFNEKHSVKQCQYHTEIKSSMSYPIYISDILRNNNTAEEKLRRKKQIDIKKKLKVFPRLVF